MVTSRPPDFLRNDHARIGEILLERGRITAEQLQAGLTRQRQENELLGMILVRLGFVTEIDVVVALVLQCGIPYIAVDQYPLAREVVALIPEEIARKYHVIALDRAGKVLSVVMADPIHATIVQDLEQRTGYRVAKFIASMSQIDQAIARAYGKSIEKK